MKSLRARWSDIVARGRKFQARTTVVRSLLALESVLTFLPWLLSWMLCAVGFAVVAGYQTAKADSEAKRKLLSVVLGGKE